MMKKLISTVLAIVFMLSFSAVAFADGEISITEDLPSSITAEEGDVYNLNVTVDANGNSSITYQVCNQNGVAKEGTCSGGKLTFQRTASTADEYIYIKFIGPGNEVSTVQCKINVTAKTEPTPTPVPALKITKSPTGETVEEGEYAVFIAKAENYDKIVWRIVSNDTSNTIPADEAESYFRGLEVDGLGTERLTLSNIPASMDGWRVEAKFVGKDGTVDFTMGAKITVIKNAPSVPSITSQPENASPASLDQSVTLTVGAKSSDGGSLKYQWYSNTTNSTSGGTAIAGATLPSFTAPKTEGTVYYFVEVRSSNNGSTSEPVYSKTASVTYPASTEPSPLPSEQPSGDNSGNDPASDVPSSDVPAKDTGSQENTPTVVVTPEPSQKNTNDKSNTMLLVIGAILVVAIIAAVVTVVILRKQDADYEE